MNPSQTRGTILLVEDDEAIRTALVELLQDEGYVVEAADTGEEGLELLSQGVKPFLILLDFMLPGISGKDFIDTVRAAPAGPYAGIPIVLISAAGDSARKVGERVEGYLRKPLLLDALLDTLDQFAARAAAEELCQEAPHSSGL